MSIFSRSPCVPVSFGWSGPPGQAVELVGDLPDWKYPVAMPEVSPGHYRCELDLEPGLYRYKFRVNGRLWFRDPLARAVDRAEPFDNGLLVVGGAHPPLMFAPDRRHVALLEDGRLLVHLEVADPAAAPAHVWVREADGSRATLPLEPVVARNGWLMLRAEGRLRMPRPRGPAWFGFAGAPEQAFPVPAPRPELGAPPPWLRGAVLYTVFVDRWHRASGSPPLPEARSRRAPSTANTFYGGDLDGVREGLGYLQDLGVDALVLTPIHRSPTPHRYDAVDLLSVDPAIGGEEALERLVADVHRRGMKLVLDVAVTHVNEAHPAFQDVLRRQQKSKHAPWFRIRRFPVVARDGATFEYYYDRPELPWLDLRPGPARRHVLKAVEKLVDFGVDGLRLDAMNDAPLDFWSELRARARARNPGLLILGEIVSDNLARFAEERAVDTGTDFRHRESMLAFFARGAIGAQEFWDRVAFDEFRTGPFDPGFRLAFLDNHDTARFLSQAVLYDRLRVALAYLMMRAEPVSLTYGTELGLAGTDPSHVLDDAWPERLPMPPLDGEPTQTQRLLRELTRLRRTLEPLRGPAMRLLRADGRLLAFERTGATGSVWAFFNAGDEALAMGPLPAAAELLLSVNDASASCTSPLAGCTARLLWVPATRRT